MSKTIVVNVKYEECDVRIMRPGKYGNPYIIGRDGTRDDVCDKHDLWLDGVIDAPNGEIPPTADEIERDLKGKRIGCCCAPKRCHGDNYVRRCEGGSM